MINKFTLKNLKESRTRSTRSYSDHPNGATQFMHLLFMDSDGLIEAAEELLAIKNPEPHQYELPDMSVDLPCAICGRPVRDEIHS